MIEKTITTVKEVLQSMMGVSGPFYIAGGYPFDPESASDIDVFFYEDADAKRVVDFARPRQNGVNFHTTSNAVTLMFKHLKNVQFITRPDRIGPPETVLETFDLRCCKVAWLSTGEVYTSPDFKKFPIELVPERISVSTLSRYLKYAERSGDTAMSGLSEIIRLFVQNFDETGDYGESGFEQILPYSHGIAMYQSDNHSVNKRICGLFLEEFKKQFSDDELIHKYATLLKSNPMFPVPVETPEGDLAFRIYSEYLRYDSLTTCRKETITKYPEYFI